MRLRDLRAVYRALTMGSVFVVLGASAAALASNPPPPPPDSPQTAKPAPPHKASDAELVKKRMRLCRRRPEVCMQQPEKKGSEKPHSPAPDEAGK